MNRKETLTRRSFLGTAAGAATAGISAPASSAAEGPRNGQVARLRDVPVMGAFDVVVCGDDPAGCAAAISAARHGAKTLLIEKYGFLGGAPVAQLVSVVLSTNGVDFQGVWHQWAERLLACRAMPWRPSSAHLRTSIRDAPGFGHRSIPRE